MHRRNSQIRDKDCPDSADHGRERRVQCCERNERNMAVKEKNKYKFQIDRRVFPGIT